MQVSLMAGVLAPSSPAVARLTGTLLGGVAHP